MIINIKTRQNAKSYKNKKSINFSQARKKEYSPYLNPRYTTPESKNNTVAILCGAKDKEYIKPFKQMTFDLAKNLIKMGYNVVTGCGSSGLMRDALDGANAVKTNATTGQNLGILVGWPDEVDSKCKIIGRATGEEQRIKYFSRCADNIVILPGSLSLMVEDISMINNKRHKKGTLKSNIVLIGKQFFAGINQQLEYMHKIGALEFAPKNLFKIEEHAKEVFKHLPKLK